MKFLLWTSVVLFSCVVIVRGTYGTPPHPGLPYLNDFEAKFMDFVSSSTIKANIKAINQSFSDIENAVNDLKTAGQTEELKSAIETLNEFVEDVKEVGLEFMGALTNLATDKTAPVTVLFEQVAATAESFEKFKADKWDPNEEKLKTAFGCVGLEQFVEVAEDVLAKILETLENIKQIGEVVLNASNLRADTEVDPIQLKNLVGAFELNVKVLKDKVTELVKVFKQIVDGIEKSNKFLMAYNAMANTNAGKMNATGTQANKTANTESTNVQNNYLAATTAIKTDLTNAIKSLNVFSGSQHLKKLVEHIKKSYTKLYNFLEKRTDLENISEFFNKLGETTAKSVNQTADIYIGAVNRTALRLADIITEGGSNADSCFNTYSKMFMMPFKRLSTYVSSCLQKETNLWSLTANAVEKLLNLTKENSKELATNLGRCSSMYAKYAKTNEDYVRAKACLQTNLRDFNDLPKTLRPLLQNVNNLVKQEAQASIFRLENCLVTNLYEDVEDLKFVRSAIEICAGMHTDCERVSREDEESEKFIRDGDAETDDGDGTDGGDETDGNDGKGGGDGTYGGDGIGTNKEYEFCGFMCADP